MRYDHAVLGESLELCRDAADWFAAEKERLEKSKKVSENIQPMVEEKREDRFVRYIDIVDEQGIPTGETIERSIAHSKGIRHRTAHIWIVRKINNRYQVLMQKRAMNKESFPGMFDTSSAGHIQAGDEPLESALRELHEELGIQAEPKELEFVGNFRIAYEKEFHGKMFRDNEIAFVYIYSQPVDETKLILQKEELETVEWFDLEQVYASCKNHDSKFCAPTGGIEVIMKKLRGETGRSMK